MKTKKFKFKQLIKLHLLKSRVYDYPIKKTNFNDLITANLDQVMIGIKKALHIIFQYHQTNKRILFIGLPSKLELKINSLTLHTAIANSFNIQGLILNSQNSTNRSLKESSALLDSKFGKKPDLIVLFDHNKSSSILTEAWVVKIPVINFADSSRLVDVSSHNSYFITGNFKSILSASDKNIFFMGLNFLFKNLKKQQQRSSSNSPKSNSKSFHKNGRRTNRKNK